MKLAIIVAVLLAAGVTGLLWMGGAHDSSLVTVAQILDEKQPVKRSITVQIAQISNAFKPLEFHAVDAPAKGKDGKVPTESRPEFEKRVRESKRMKVIYSGDDHLQLSNYNYVHIEGAWNSEKQCFEATSISTQCPSHYENEAKQVEKTQ